MTAKGLLWLGMFLSAATASDAARCVDQSRIARPERRGLIASPQLDGQPVKGVYFFPGERGANEWMYTSHPLDLDDGYWNSNQSTRPQVIGRMVDAHLNTIVMSYWSNMPQWSPMVIDPTSVPGVLDAAQDVLNAPQGRPITIMPALEGGFDEKIQKDRQWQFAGDFPRDPLSGAVAPGLVERIGQLADLFRGRMDLWTQMYDRDGYPRYAVNIIHASSNVIEQVPGTDDDREFAEAFDAVADQVCQRFRIAVGFTLDAIGRQRFSPTPGETGPLLNATSSVLAIQGFASEVFSGLIKGTACPAEQPWQTCKPYDNNVDSLEHLANWKRDALQDWVRTGVPVILDGLNGFDGRIVWKETSAGFWGDNLDYTDDRWRNSVSELKGRGAVGIVVDTWNGYTEGYAAVPTVEHGWTVYRWLSDLMEPDPRDCSHMHYVDGAATHRVYGAICSKWIRLGAERGFGAPISDELPSARGRVSHFVGGGSIYWSDPTGAHEVHGLIGQTYRRAGADASCLGLPTSDQEPNGSGRISRFEHGDITWTQGDEQGHIQCR